MKKGLQGASSSQKLRMEDKESACLARADDLHGLIQSGSWDDISGETFLRGLLSQSIQLAQYSVVRQFFHHPDWLTCDHVTAVTYWLCPISMSPMGVSVILLKEYSEA